MPAMTAKQALYMAETANPEAATLLRKTAAELMFNSSGVNAPDINPATPQNQPIPITYRQIPVNSIQPDKGRLNKLERRYAEHLNMLKSTGLVVDFWEHPGSLRLGFNNRYEPDFLVQFPDHLEYVDTKGFMREDSYEKIKNAATKFWTFRFQIAKWDAKSKQWNFREVRG